MTLALNTSLAERSGFDSPIFRHDKAANTTHYADFRQLHLHVLSRSWTS